MNQRTKNILNVIALIVGIIGAVGLFLFLILKWPLYTGLAGLAYAGFILVGISQEFMRQKSLARTLKGSGEIHDEETGQFIGIYGSGWEESYITVPTGQSRLMWPLFETWLPQFPKDESIPDCFDTSKSYFIRFRGRPSVRGNYGHMDLAKRTVMITEIIELRPE